MEDHQTKPCYMFDPKVKMATTKNVERQTVRVSRLGSIEDWEKEHVKAVVVDKVIHNGTLDLGIVKAKTIVVTENQILQLPRNVERLFFRGNFNSVIPELPTAVRILVIDSKAYELQIDAVNGGHVPSSIKVLKFCTTASMDPRLCNFFGTNLSYLQLESDFTSPLTSNMFPVTLSFLHLGGKFNQSVLPGSLPQGLKRLILGDKFNQDIEKGALPDSLTSLTIESSYDKVIASDVLPLNLKSLQVHHVRSTCQISLPKQLTHFHLCLSPDSPFVRSTLSPSFRDHIKYFRVGRVKLFPKLPDYDAFGDCGECWCNCTSNSINPDEVFFQPFRIRRI